MVSANLVLCSLYYVYMVFLSDICIPFSGYMGRVRPDEIVWLTRLHPGVCEATT
jgi:hypothetical protein